MTAAGGQLGQKSCTETQSHTVSEICQEATHTQLKWRPVTNRLHYIFTQNILLGNSLVIIFLAVYKHACGHVALPLVFIGLYRFLVMC